MLPFALIYTPGYYLPIGQHVFPAEKYRRIHDHLRRRPVSPRSPTFSPRSPLPMRTCCSSISRNTSTNSRPGRSPRARKWRWKFPTRENWCEAFWLAAGGSILAADRALEDRIAVNIGGGFHHAFPDHGEGFCMIHDVAIAIRRMQRDGRIRTAMTVDCDVHHGNGTAAIFAGTRTPSAPLPSKAAPIVTPGRLRAAHAGDVFTISLHQHNNYPAYKPLSSIDVDLPDGIGDDDYLAWLDNALSSGLRQFSPDLICYVAGADPYAEDQLGGLSLTIAGLKRRDELVFRVAKARDIPVMVTYAGGYARRLEDTVTIHCNTVIAAEEAFGG